MDARSPSQDPYYDPTTSGASGHSARVDPRYPLQSPAGPSQQSRYPDDGSTAQDPSLGRNPSRRRKVSGQNYTRNPDQSEALPAAPDVPRGSRGGPPVSYRDPYANGDVLPDPGPSGPSARSFAARAGQIPESVDPVLANSIAVERMPAVETRDPARRSSTNQPPGLSYPQVQQPAVPQYSSTSADAGNARRAKSTDRRPVQQHLNTNIATQNTEQASPQPRSATSRIASAGTPADWAADRSPLQRLEVKLNDISKEEKRARVQEAEQRLRESKARRSSTQKGTGSTNPSVNRSSSQRVSSGSQRKESRDYNGKQSDVPQPHDPAIHEHTTRGIARGTADTGSQRKRVVSGPTYQNVGAERSPRVVSQPAVSLPVDQGGRRKSTDVRAGTDRGVRFHDPTVASPIDDLKRQDEKISGGSPVTNMQQTNTLRGKPIEPKDGNSREGLAPDPIPPDAVHSHSHGHGSKYEVPPQTAAGIEARHRVGFGSRLDEATDVPTHHKHHLSQILHRRHEHQATIPQPSGPPRHLDEWRQGKTVRLTLSDVAPPVVTSATQDGNKQAWWESPKSASQRRRKSRPESSDPDSSTFDGSYDDNNGEIPFPHPRRVPSIATTRDTLEPVRARQYIGYEGTRRVRRRNRIFRHGHRSLMGERTATGLLRTPTSFYSYSCPHLSQHDPSHKSHICQPYLSKELMMSMRSIRVRFPAAPTTFEPPLLLKCGPLLRYTGLRREKLETPTAQTGYFNERETWRGSVMIVTVDSQSSYKTAPTLWLFHQPMSLLPPPPQQFDGESGEGLPSEYVDPIAGIPKISRTGGIVYVKPVEDLDEGKDVSRVENDDGLYEETRTANVPTAYGKADEFLGRSPLPALNKHKSTQQEVKRSGRVKEVAGIRLHAERGVTFWRFNIEVELGDKEARIAYRINKGASTGFWVPARGQTMNMMFHSCNGFSMSVDPNTFSGPDPLWRDVLNAHQTKPFHVMLGGGDQIYNDAVMKQTKLFQEWLELKNPIEKHQVEFTQEMQEELETFYLERYSMWFSQGLFGMANSQIPMINIWDDHDIIDGFGSYPHSFMSTPVFCGLGNIAFKYYMLFQHQSVVDEVTADEPSWLLGASPGPYINELSRSIFTFLGKKVAFLGLDCRTERMREEILSESSYDLVFDRLRREVVKGETKHLIVLLGVPIAYPRLVWLENVLTSRALDPIKALGRMGMFGNFLNKFDGGVEILDDLDDHWTARNHKDERNWFIEELQQFAAEKSVRITILSGDVHLAAVGQFFSNKKLNVPKDQDFRYIPNIISSAIVNTPPPDMMADVLNKRNKIHHLNPETDEDMIPMFTHDVDGKPRNNKRLLPKRNWCSIAEYLPGSTPPPTPPSQSPTASQESIPQHPPGLLQRTLSLGRGDTGKGPSTPSKLIRRLSLTQRRSSYDQASAPHNGLSPMSPPGRSPRDIQSAPVTPRIVSAPPIPIRPVSTFHRRPTNLSEKAAAKGGATGGHVDLEFGLDIKLNCEIKQGDPSGSTESYRLLVPALHFDGVPIVHKPRKQTFLQRLGSKRQSKAAARQGSGEWGQSGSETGSDSEDEYNGRNSDAYMRPVVHQQQPQSAGHSGKELKPFQPRPQSQIQPHTPATATIQPHRMEPRQTEQLPQPAAHNTTAPLSNDDDDDDDYSDDEYHTMNVPQRRRSKFDAGGASKFFGANVGGGDKVKRDSGVSNEYRSSGEGYSGIEAYQEEKKGWRRFF